MKKNKKQWMQWAGVFLTVVLILANLLGITMTDTVEPVNPIAKEYDKLEYEIAEGNLTSGKQDGEEQQEPDGDENAKEQQGQKGREQQKQDGEQKETKSKQEKKKGEQGKEQREQTVKAPVQKNDSGVSQGNQTDKKNDQSDNENKNDENKNDGNKNDESKNGESNNADGKKPKNGESDGEEIEGGAPSRGGSEETDGGESETEEDSEQPGTEDSEEPDTQEDSEVPESPEDTEAQEEDENAGLVTDLESKIITFSELSDDTLNFYAYYSDATVDANIKVNYKHESETGNGTWLTASGRNYSTKLTMGKNVIVVYYSDKKGQRNYSSFTITYEAERATEDEPEVGDKPPVIETNLDSWTGEITTQAFTFTVKAKTAEGAQIYSNHIDVKLDGQTVTNPTGSAVYEYVLNFNKPVVGETEAHKVTVLAWDDAGNSKMVTYNVTYRSIDEGEVTGQARVVVDATTVGVGILADETVDIIQGKPASYTLLAALDQMDFEYEYAGTEMVGFYIRSISRGNAFKKAAIPTDLLTLIERDGLELRPACSKNKLSEYDFTQGSGWLYSVNGGEYAGKGLSEWNLNDGDTLYLRYTVAYGKDVGGTQEEYGRLKSYCGMWIDGGYIPLAHVYAETRVEPTETEDGYVEYCCINCEHTYREVIPHLTSEESEGMSPSETKRTRNAKRIISIQKLGRFDEDK